MERRRALLANGTPLADTGWSDERLVAACLDGDESAWEALVDRYKHLVHGIAVRYGATPEEAADLFQSVWLDAYNDLPKLRKRTSLRSWLISLATHRCYHWKRKTRRRAYRETTAVEPAALDGRGGEEPAFVAELERDQLVREALAGLTPRCREMIQLLFFHTPTLPYREVAGRLGLATGSIGFLRARCLERLRAIVDALGGR